MVCLLFNHIEYGRAAERAEDLGGGLWGGRPPVAVLGFENKTGDPRQAHWRCMALVIASGLSHARAIRVLPDEAINYGLRQLKKKFGDPIEASEARKLGELIEARRVTWGSYQREGEQWLVTVEVLNVGTGKGSNPLKVASTNWFEIRRRLTELILQELAISIRETERTNIFELGTRSLTAMEWLMKARLIMLENGSLTEMEHCARQSLAADPQYAGALTCLASALAGQGKEAEAIVAARQALKLQPDMASAHHALGILLCWQNKLDEGESELRTALRLEPDDGEACYRLGVLYGKQDWETRALIYFKKAVDLNPFSASDHASLGQAYASQQQREAAIGELREAERLGSDDDVNAEQMLVRAYTKIHELPQALEHCDKFLKLGRKIGLGPQFLQAYEAQRRELTARLAPEYITVPMPRVFTEQTLLEALQAKLDPNELKLVPQSLAATPEMTRWAQELTRGATNDLQKAKQLFETLTRRLDRGAGGIRTAQQVFKEWDQPRVSFYCQEYARLFIALARAAGLKTFFVNVEKDYEDQLVSHDCAAVVLGDKFLLVDATYLWFGVRHKSFKILDDFQATAHHLGQFDDLARNRAAFKLEPESAIIQYNLAERLMEAGRWDEAQAVIEKEMQRHPNTWSAKAAQGNLAWHAKNTEAALAFLKEASALNPLEGTLHMNIGLLYQEQGKLREAREAFRKALHADLDQKHTESTRQAIAWLNEKLGSD